MAEKKKLSVQEMLALARKQGAGGGEGATESPAPAAEETKPAEAPAASAPAEEPVAAAAEPVAEAPKSAAPKPAAGGKLSVADMLAAARAQGAGGKAPAAAAPKPPVEKKEPAPKPAAAEKKEKPAAGPTVGGPKDTASILAAARKTAKPGPITKAEAAAKEKPEAEAKPAKGVVPPMPPKPEYAKPKAAAKAGEEETRRGFTALLFGSMLSLGYTAMAATAGLWTLGFARFMFPNILTEPPSKFKVGFPSDFAPGKVEEKFKAQFGVWIVNTEYNGSPEIFALRTVCTHLGCTPNWLEAEQKFKCPCHGSGFYKDGINFEGPAPRPLERYAISISDDGQLEVDKGKLFFEEMGQWSDPSSFYPA
jgi:cytochrome b6-f complex iron-sulfur subunit